MRVNLFPRDLNLDPCAPHSISIYNCGVTITPRVRSGINLKFSAKALPFILYELSFITLH